MRTPILMLAFALTATVSCRKDADTTNPEEGTGGGMLGLDVSPGSEGEGSRGGSTVKVPVKCIQDPQDPDCEESLGYTRTDGTLEFGDTCRENLCHGGGDCLLDADGFVSCECDDDRGGLNCEKRRRS